MNDPRRDKINTLKSQITLEQGAVKQMITTLAEPMPDGLTDEQKKEKMQSFRNDMAVKRASIKGMEEELKLVRMNKNSSSFFDWAPHKGMNRRQARAFRKQNRV